MGKDRTADGGAIPDASSERARAPSETI